MNGRTGPPTRRTGPLPTDPSNAAVTANDTGSVAQAPDDPLEDRFPGFRAAQAIWKRRIMCSRRLERLGDGVTDPAAPHGRWSQ